MKALIIEDDKAMISPYKSWFDKYVKEDDGLFIIFATSILEAEEQFKFNQDINAIFIDGCILGRDGYLPSRAEGPNTLGLVLEMRKTFKGRMIATSGHEEYSNQLVEAGCDDRCEKTEVPQKVLDVFGLKKK